MSLNTIKKSNKLAQVALVAAKNANKLNQHIYVIT